MQTASEKRSALGPAVRRRDGALATHLRPRRLGGSRRPGFSAGRARATQVWKRSGSCGRHVTGGCSRHPGSGAVCWGWCVSSQNPAGSSGATPGSYKLPPSLLPAMASIYVFLLVFQSFTPLDRYIQVGCL